jgi:hypothetical protein
MCVIILLFYGFGGNSSKHQTWLMFSEHWKAYRTITITKRCPSVHGNSNPKYFLLFKSILWDCFSEVLIDSSFSSPSSYGILREKNSIIPAWIFSDIWPLRRGRFPRLWTSGISLTMSSFLLLFGDHQKSKENLKKNLEYFILRACNIPKHTSAFRLTLWRFLL